MTVFSEPLYFLINAYFIVDGYIFVIKNAPDVANNKASRHSSLCINNAFCNFITFAYFIYTFLFAPF